jgi:hypothetical protein
MKRIIECFLIGICLCDFCNAQQAISTAGGEATGAGGTVSYTIGQVAYTYFAGTGGTITQGVQQSYEILVLKSTDDKYGIHLEFSVYPNPVNEYLTLKVENETIINMAYQLYDMNGTLLENRKLEGSETYIQMDKLAPASYILKVTNYEKEIKTFKIVKY